MTSSKLIYLASPYSHPDDYVRQDRFTRACFAAGRLMREGHHVFSPIAYTHPIATRCDLPMEFDYWSNYDQMMIRKCDAFYVLTLDGWDTSVGVLAEIQFVLHETDLTVTYLDRHYGDLQDP